MQNEEKNSTADSEKPGPAKLEARKEPGTESKPVETEKALPGSEPQQESAPAAPAAAAEEAEQEGAAEVAEVVAAESTDTLEKKAEAGEATPDEPRIKA